MLMSKKNKIANIMGVAVLAIVAVLAVIAAIDKNAVIFSLILIGLCFIVAYGWRELEYIAGESGDNDKEVQD